MLHCNRFEVSNYQGDVVQALQQCGTEFSVMETFFPDRTRKELKMKFFRYIAESERN